jgi:hypothetical protein
MSSDGGNTCDETAFIKTVDKYKYGIFDELSVMSINFELQSPSSNFERWCPLLLKNTHIVKLRIQAKPIRFVTSNSSYNVSGIQNVEFYSLVVDKFDKEILHPQVYSLLNTIVIIGSVKKIETDLFKDIKYLQEIVLSMNDLKGFIHGNGIEWMNYVNYYANRRNVSKFELECDLNCLLSLNSSVSRIEFKIKCT